MAKPLVSIVTPTFNAVRFIRNNILTVKNQSYPNIEHIIVDGGSVDGTLEIVKQYEGTYNMHWISEPDHGLYDAINKGLRMAKGDILADLDSDDLYLPWSVECGVNALESNSLVFGDWIGIDPDVDIVNLEARPSYISSYYRSAGTIPQPTVFWRRKVVETIGYFDESLRFLADVEYWLRAEKSGIVPYKINEIMAIACHPRSSITQSKINQEELNREFLEIRSKYASNFERKLWKHFPMSPVARRIAISIYWLRFLPFWPRFSSSQSVKPTVRDVIKIILYGNRRSFMKIEWTKLLPSGIYISPTIDTRH